MADSNVRMTERMKIQQVQNSAPSIPTGQETQRASIKISTIEREGELLWVLPDGDHHERRIQRAVVSDDDRVFWATIAIACGSPQPLSSGGRVRVGRGVRRFSKLPMASNDLNAFYEYYRPMKVGDPRFAGASPGLGKSPGFFDTTERLNNPTLATLREALRRIREWIVINQEDPEYTSCQLNFCFSGHGELDAAGRAGIVLHDVQLGAEELTSMLVECVSPIWDKETPCRLDLYLDCCYAAAVASAVEALLGFGDESPFKIGQVYCACLDDEESYEFDDLPHGVFTFAFLNECSRRRPDGADRINLGLRDVGWFTGGRQHPLLVDRTIRGTSIKFPSSYYRTNWPAGAERPPQAAKFTLDGERFLFFPVEQALVLAHTRRDEVRALEQVLELDDNARTPFSRDEILTNKRFPFL